MTVDEVQVDMGKSHSNFKADRLRQLQRLATTFLFLGVGAGLLSFGKQGDAQGLPEPSSSAPAASVSVAGESTRPPAPGTELVRIDQLRCGPEPDDLAKRLGSTAGARVEAQTNIDLDGDGTPDRILRVRRGCQTSKAYHYVLLKRPGCWAFLGRILATSIALEGPANPLRTIVARGADAGPGGQPPGGIVRYDLDPYGLQFEPRRVAGPPGDCLTRETDPTGGSWRPLPDLDGDGKPDAVQVNFARNVIPITYETIRVKRGACWRSVATVESGYDDKPGLTGHVLVSSRRSPAKDILLTDGTLLVWNGSAYDERSMASKLDADTIAGPSSTAAPTCTTSAPTGSILPVGDLDCDGVTDFVSRIGEEACCPPRTDWSYFTSNNGCWDTKNVMMFGSYGRLPLPLSAGFRTDKLDDNGVRELEIRTWTVGYRDCFCAPVAGKCPKQCDLSSD
jgi:hypothetical protein